MDAWVRGVEAAIATDRRALCASAALQRAESPPVNLAGLDSAWDCPSAIAFLLTHS